VGVAGVGLSGLGLGLARGVVRVQAWAWTGF
jgi:hypothetical protein